MDHSQLVQTTPRSNSAIIRPDESGKQEDIVVPIEEHVSGLSVGASAGLHRFCAEGKLDELREVLSKGLDGLETLDVVTGCTPIVLAIRNNHPEVVRELLSAGAIIPPPGLTSDPLLLSILYPQPMYGMPSHFLGQPMSVPTDFVPQQGFFPAQDGQRGIYLPFQQAPSRKESLPNAQTNLPPTEVAKTIPCRNFPNCKYGAGCVFYHPRPHAPGFYPAAQSFASSGGYDQPYVSFGSIPGPFFMPNNTNTPFHPQQNAPLMPSPTQHEQPQSPHEYRSHTQTQPEIPKASITQHDQTPSPAVPSAIAPPFIPAFSMSQTRAISLTPPPSQFGASAISPSLTDTSPISVSNAEAFFATSPTNGHEAFLPGMNGSGHLRRQSLNPQPFGMPGKTFGHGKKLSFSGIPRPWGQSRNSVTGGSWKDGNPPPCAFFAQGKCRNGELCKFPHLDADGNDCRHPDVVRGLIPPLPTLSRQPRAMRMMHAVNNGSFDTSFRFQHQQQIHFLHQHRQFPERMQKDSGKAIPGGQIEGRDAEPENTPKPVLPVSIPARPDAVLESTPAMSRSVSQPGVQRLTINGISPSGQSPAPSNVSFHGNGHSRRAGSRTPYSNSSGHNDGRSVSVGAQRAKAVPQRIPEPGDFPALSGTTSPNADKVDSMIQNKTAARILSLHAPTKLVGVKIASPDLDEGEDHQSLTMKSEPDSDAVIIPGRSSNTSTPLPSTSQPSRPTHSQRGSISFATAALSNTTIESPPIRVKA